MAHPLPPVPSADAYLLTLDEAAGFLRMRRTTVNRIRRTDPTFPKPRLITPGAPRIRRADLQKWVDGLPEGWSTVGAHNRVNKEASSVAR